MKFRFSVLSVLVLSIIACVAVANAPEVVDTTREFGWVRPKNDYETKFREARTLAEQIMRHPVCRAQFEQLPDWPPGEVPTEIIYDELLARTTRAFTNMRSNEIFLLVQTLRSSSVEYMAKTLIHELAHSSSRSDFDALLELDEEEDAGQIQSIKRENELLVQRVTRICVRAAGIA